MRDFREARLRREEIVLDAVDLQCSRVDGAAGIHIAMEAVARDAAVDDLDATDLDYPVAGFGLETGGLRVEHDLSHRRAATQGA